MLAIWLPRESDYMKNSLMLCVDNDSFASRIRPKPNLSVRFTRRKTVQLVLFCGEIILWFANDSWSTQKYVNYGHIIVSRHNQVKPNTMQHRVRFLWAIHVKVCVMSNWGFDTLYFPSSSLMETDWKIVR